MIAILTSVRWHLSVDLICISLIINRVEHLFMCLWAICISFLEKCLFRSSSQFLTRFFVFFFFKHWIIWIVCIFWILTPCPLYHLYIFSPISFLYFMSYQMDYDFWGEYLQPLSGKCKCFKMCHRRKVFLFFMYFQLVNVKKHFLIQEVEFFT